MKTQTIATGKCRITAAPLRLLWEAVSKHWIIEIKTKSRWQFVAESNNAALTDEKWADLTTRKCLT